MSTSNISKHTKRYNIKYRQPLIRTINTHGFLLHEQTINKKIYLSINCSGCKIKRIMAIPNTQIETSHRNSQLLFDSTQVERKTSTVYPHRPRRRTSQIIRILPPPSRQTSMWNANNSRLFKLDQRQSRTTNQNIKKLY